jgi:hypothetical protein
MGICAVGIHFIMGLNRLEQHSKSLLLVSLGFLLAGGFI